MLPLLVALSMARALGLIMATMVLCTVVSSVSMWWWKKLFVGVAVLLMVVLTV